jgi:hypothetical protein
MKWLPATFFFASLAMAQSVDPKTPALLNDALRQLPGVRLLDPPRDLPGGYTIEEIRKLGYWPPWVVIDLDGDRQPDVVAEVVKRLAGTTQFGILALHTQTPGQIHWVVALQKDPLNGVAAGDSGTKVTPLFCLYCDANGWFRWSGRAYEAMLYELGDRITIAPDEGKETLDLLALPNRQSRSIGKIAQCKNAKVLGIRGASSRDRWYFVEISRPTVTRGWVSASHVSEEAGVCE